MTIEWFRTTDAQVAHAFPPRKRKRANSLCGQSFKGARLHHVAPAGFNDRRNVRHCRRCASRVRGLQLLMAAKQNPAKLAFLKAAAKLQDALQKFSAAVEALTEEME